MLPSWFPVSKKVVPYTMDQQELEARYAQCASAKNAVFVYAGHVTDACARPGVMAGADVLLDMVGGQGLRVADVRAASNGVHGAGGRLLVDITVPSHFGCSALELGADVQLEALDRVAAGKLACKVVAFASRGVLPFESDTLLETDLTVIAEGLDSLSVRMQRHFDCARALAEYLACCEGPLSAAYPGLADHPDHDLATRVLRHGFGPAVEFELPESWGISAGEFIERCRLNERSCAAGGSFTRLHARDGAHGRAVRMFAGMDDPLAIAADLDCAFRSLR